MAEESGPHPIGGVDYPRTLPEFNDWFSSEAACLAFPRRAAKNENPWVFERAVSEKHLDYYLDELTFRFNRRRSGARGLLF